MRLCILLLAASASHAQNFTQRGYLETSVYLYPQTAPGDSGRVVGQGLLHYEFSYKASAAFRFSGAVEAQTDTHRDTERFLHLYWLDRVIQRPAVAVTGLNLSYTRGKLRLQLGKQTVRWGKADILNPTDRFAPKDFLNVFRTVPIAVTAARMTYGGQSNSIDLVFVPFFIPSRAPLLNHRWVGLPPEVPITDDGARYPGGTQFGGRFNHIGRVAEWSLSYFDGYNHLPLIDYAIVFVPKLGLEVQRFFPRIRSYGLDAAIPLKPATLKIESAYSTSSTRESGEYLLYVLQLERQSGEFSFVGGYTGEVVTRPTLVPDFNPDRGLARSIVGRAAYTISASKNVALETAVRQNGKGFLLKGEYSQSFGQHWRATPGFALIRGSDSDFIGNYNHNSFFTFALRYSF